MDRLPNSYLSGQWVDSERLSLGVDDLGLQQGVAISERLRTFAGEPYRLEDHLSRLHRSLEIIGLPATRVCDEVASVLPEVVARNRIGLAEGDDLAVILFVTPGLVDWNVRHLDCSSARPTVCVYARPLPFVNWADCYRRGERIVVSRVRQVPSGCWPPELKCRSRLHYFLADREADERDRGARAVLLDTDGYLCEASTANIVIVRDGTLVSPQIEKILPGVSLSTVKRLADELSIPFTYCDILPEELGVVDEIMLASTSSCLLPVTACDGRQVGGGRPGEMCHRLLDSWSRHVGVDIVAQARKFRTRGS